MDAKNQSMTASWISIMAASWLTAAPYIFGYTDAAAKRNDLYLGVTVGILAIIRAFTPERTPWISAITIIAGIWLMTAPFAFGYTDIEAFWNDIILGIVVSADALWNLEAGYSAQRKLRSL